MLEPAIAAFVSVLAHMFATHTATPGSPKSVANLIVGWSSGVVTDGALFDLFETKLTSGRTLAIRSRGTMLFTSHEITEELSNQ